VNRIEALECWESEIDEAVPARGFPRVHDLDRNESVLTASRARNQRWRDAGVGMFRFVLIGVLCLGIALASKAAAVAPAAHPTRQQTEVLLLSALRFVSAASARELVVVVSRTGLTMNTRAHDGRWCV
jgi:hypothetical protein